MGIAGRLKRLWSSTRSARQEDPEALRARLDQTYRSQVQMLAQVRRGVADVTTSRKRVEVQLATMRAEIAALDTNSRQAVASGDDDSAREMLTRKVSLERAAGELGERHASLRAEEDRLRASAIAAERRIEDFRTKKDTLTARYSAATARAEIDAVSAGITAETNRIGQAMSDAERHTRELEATSAALDELVSEGVVPEAGESADEALRRRFDQAFNASGTGNDSLRGGDHGPQQISQ